MDFENNDIPQEQEPSVPASEPQKETLVENVPAEDNSPAQFTLNESLEQPKKKKSKGLLIGIVAAVAVIALVVGLLFALGVFEKEEALPADPHEAMYLQEQQALYGAADTIANYVGALSASGATDTSGTQMDMRLLLSDDFLSLVEMYYATMGVDMDISWLKEIGLSYDLNLNDSAMQLLLELDLSKTEIAGIDMILSEDSYYIGMPGLNPYYMKHGLTDSQTDGTAAFDFAGTMQKSTAIRQAFIEALPNEEAVQESLRRYIDLLLPLLKDPTLGTETMTINGTEQSVSTVTYKVTATQLIDALIAVLNQAKTDESLKQLVTAYSNYENESAKITNPDATPEDLYSQMLDTLQEGIDELEESKAECDPNDYLLLTGYLDSEQHLLGHQVTVSEAEKAEYVALRWIRTINGNTKSTDVTLHDGEEFTMSITGEETSADGVYNGTFTFTGDGKKTLTLKLQDIKATKESVTGSVLLTPNAALLEELTEDSSLPLTLLGNELGLKLTFDLNATAPSAQLHLVANEASLISFNLTVTSHDAAPIVIPDKDKLRDQEQWEEAIDIDALFENLKKAGFPAEILDALAELPISPETAE